MCRLRCMPFSICDGFDLCPFVLFVGVDVLPPDQEF